MQADKSVASKTEELSQCDMRERSQEARASELAGKVQQLVEEVKVEVQQRKVLLEEVQAEVLAEQLKAKKLEKRVFEVKTESSEKDIELQNCKITLTETKEEGKSLRCHSPCTISKIANNDLIEMSKTETEDDEYQKVTTEASEDIDVSTTTLEEVEETTESEPVPS